ncbi:hypothetical protein GQ457_07G013410 [Hibiscus cannabinus]
MRGIPRIRYFLWLVVHGRILTNVERVRRHFSNDMRCGVCGLDVESIDHLFRKCPPAISLWSSLVRPGDLSAFLSMEFLDWLRFNLTQSSNFHQRFQHWDLLFGSILWALWKFRNAHVFGSNSGRCGLWEECTQLYDQCLVARTYGRQQLPAVRVNGEQVQHWQLPRSGWCKLNTDGSCRLGSRLASCGGVLRSDSGSWVCGFSRFVGRCTALEAEFWGVLEGLRLAWSRQVAALVLEVDSLEVYECLLYRKSCGGFSAMVHSIFELLDRPWQVLLSRVPRSANKVADGLAKLCHVPADSEVLVLDNFSAHVFFDPPVSLLHLLQDDWLSAFGFS